jgi:hypothetical protein
MSNIVFLIRWKGMMPPEYSAVVIHLYSPS